LAPITSQSHHVFHCIVAAGADPVSSGCREILGHLGTRAASQRAGSLEMGERSFTFGPDCELSAQSVMCRTPSTFGMLGWWEFGPGLSSGEIHKPEEDLREQLRELGAKVVDVPTQCSVADGPIECSTILYELPGKPVQLVLWGYGREGERRYRLVCDAAGELDELPPPCSTIISMTVEPSGP